MGFLLCRGSLRVCASVQDVVHDQWLNYYNITGYGHDDERPQQSDYGLVGVRGTVGERSSANLSDFLYDNSGATMRFADLLTIARPFANGGRLDQILGTVSLIMAYGICDGQEVW
jgi:hypothetical protein